MTDQVNGPVRRLAAVWFADIVGYTSLSSKDENAALDLVAILQRIAREEIAKYGGRIVKYIGDAVLADFGSSDSALRAALSLRDRFDADSKEAGLPAKLRIGIHVGDVVGTPDGDLYGDGINTASRVQGAADVGHIWVTEDVWNQLRQRRDFQFDFVGERKLKGLEGRKMYSARMTGAQDIKEASQPPVSYSVRSARVVRVALVYMVVSLALMVLTGLLRSRLALPTWVLSGGLVLLMIGLVVIVATGWVQTRPAAQRRVRGSSDPWKVDIDDIASSVRSKHLPMLTWGRAVLGGALAFALLFGSAGMYALVNNLNLLSFGPQPAVGQSGVALAILPFEASGSEAELWQDGIGDLLALDLDGAAGLRIIDPRSVRNGWHDEGERTDSITALRLANQLSARYAVVGSATETQGRITIEAKVYDNEDASLIGSVKESDSRANLPDLIDRVGEAILRTGVTTGGVPQLNLGRLASSSIPALLAYLEGVREFRQSRWPEAKSAFGIAIAADSTFAQALYRLSLSTSWATYPHALTPDVNSARARRHAAMLPPRDRTLIEAWDDLLRGSPSAIQTLEAFTGSYPDDVEGMFLLGDAYFHRQDSQFRFALTEVTRRDPTFGPAYMHLVEDAIAQRRRSDAEALKNALRGADPGSPYVGMLDVAIASASWDSEQAPAVARAGPSSATRDDSAERAYDAARQRAEEARTAAVRVGVTTRQPDMARGDSLRAAASQQADRGDYEGARPQMELAKLSYGNAQASAVWTQKLDSMRAVIGPLQSTRLSQADAAEIQRLRGQAEDAEAEGRYDDATRSLRSVIDRYRDAAAAAARPQEPTARAEPPAPQPTAPQPAAPSAPTLSADEIATQVVEEFRSAIERKDMDALQAVWPTLTAAQWTGWQTTVDRLNPLQVRIQRLSVTPGTDRVSVRIRTTLEGRNVRTGERGPNTLPEQTLQLEERNGRWVIVAIS